MAIKLIKKSDELWLGDKGFEKFKMVRKPIGRGFFTYHVYRDDYYIANGKSFDTALQNANNWLKINK